MNERTCITCHHAGFDSLSGRFCCKNTNSMYLDEYVGSDKVCPQWKEPESKGEVWYE